jgi:hypothetical protein
MTPSMTSLFHTRTVTHLHSSVDRKFWYLFPSNVWGCLFVCMFALAFLISVYVEYADKAISFRALAFLVVLSLVYPILFLWNGKTGLCNQDQDSSCDSPIQIFPGHVYCSGSRRQLETIAAIELVPHEPVVIPRSHPSTEEAYGAMVLGLAIASVCIIYWVNVAYCVPAYVVIMSAVPLTRGLAICAGKLRPVRYRFSPGRLEVIKTRVVSSHTQISKTYNLNEVPVLIRLDLHTVVIGKLGVSEELEDKVSLDCFAAPHAFAAALVWAALVGRTKAPPTAPDELCAR